MMKHGQLPTIKIIQITPIEILGRIWLCVAFEEKDHDMGDAMHLALVYRDRYLPSDNLNTDIETMFKGHNNSPLVRIHSECLLGDALYSDLCDCGEQLRSGLRSIISHESGIILYLRQEGRGIGMRAKLACLAAQEGYIDGIKSVSNMSPDEANLYFGFSVDERDYSVVPAVLKLLHVNQVKMMTGNLDKLDSVTGAGIIVSSVTDINRSHIVSGSRKHRELAEKAARNYNYQTL